MGVNTKSNGFFYRNRTVFKMGLVALVIAATADLVAGLFLGSMENILAIVPGMIILVYSAIGMRGNIFGAMGSRLGTAMHIGTFDMSFKKGGVLRANIESSIGLTMFISLAMGLIGWVVVVLFDFIAAGTLSGFAGVHFVFISMFGGLLAGLVLLVFNLIIATVGYKREWDIDNITAPLIAAAGDIVTMPMLALSAWIVIETIDTSVVEIMTIGLVILTVSVLLYILLRKVVKGHIDEAKRIIRQSSLVLTICLLFDIVAGVVIQGQQDTLLLVPVLLVLMPAFLNEGNALSGMLTSRLSSMIHLGTLEVGPVPKKSAFENFKITYVLAVVTYAYIGVIAFVATYLFYGSVQGTDFLSVMAIVMLAGLLATTVLNFLSYYVAAMAVKFNLDPDDHSIPITSSSMDLIGASILIMIISLVIVI